MTKNKYYYSDGTTSSELDYGKTLHRKDGPAIEYADGSKAWWIKGELHQTDGPAIKYADGTKFWYLNGKCHREDGPAIEYVDGYKAWYLNGKLHRTDGPTIEWVNGDKKWHINGKTIVYYRAKTGKYRLYYDAHTVITEEQARLVLAKHGISL